MGGELRRCSGGVTVMLFRGYGQADGRRLDPPFVPTLDGDRSAPVGCARGRSAKPDGMTHPEPRGERVASVSGSKKVLSEPGDTRRNPGMPDPWALPDPGAPPPVRVGVPRAGGP
jgi:hypothetical protein